MTGNRRKFIWTAGVIAGASVMGSSTVLARQVASTVAQQDVTDIISRYGSQIQVTQSGDRAVEYRVKVSDIGRFEKVFTSQHELPFDRIYVTSGNTLKFIHGGIDFTIVNVT